jgi:peptide-methionine (S)-S-oxide reductase
MSSLLSRIFRPFTSSASSSAMSTAAAAGPAEIPDGAQRATVAAGCFWGVEHVYRKAFGNGGGLLDARVGYIGGESENPSYKEVCSGTTGREYIPSFIRIASNAVPLP